MDFFELIRRRQSTRSFDPQRSISQDVLTACLEAVRLSPSASNAQPYQLHVCTGEMAQKVAKATQRLGMHGFVSDAPVLVVMSEKPYNLTAGAGAKVAKQDYRSMDIGIAAAHMTLAAEQQGLGSCMLGWFDEGKIKSILDIKERVRLVIALGYPTKEDIRAKKRKSLEELVKYRSEK